MEAYSQTERYILLEFFIMSRPLHGSGLRVLAQKADQGWKFR